MAAAAGGAPKPRRRLLHTSDVHLGGYDTGPEYKRDEVEATFRSVIDLGREAGVDGLLIAGDFFDNARVRPETLEFAATEIARLERPVVIGPGNHDHVGPGSVYDRYPFHEVANLQMIRDPEGETLALDGLGIEVWGRPHTERVLDFKPFLAPPPRGSAPWQIGIGHGHYIHPQAVLEHSFHIREAHLASTERDYVALGHWEQLTRVAAGDRVVAAYSGCPEGLAHRKGGWALIVDLMEDGAVVLTAHPLGGEAGLSHDEIPLLLGLPE